MPKKRRGTGVVAARAKAGVMASSKGSAMATPAPRRIVLREMEFGILV